MPSLLICATVISLPKGCIEDKGTQMNNSILIAIVFTGLAFATILAWQADSEMDEEIRNAMRYEQNQEKIRRAIEGDNK